ncbi:hypothetical protein Kpol_1028p10 [Vanderwaltozyma polyspora DSM 70294]|uniref:Protein OCA4 n=1 Tax=Vanderwaltozyma polyspora (strain ATCC 22028 / DSM 70294 / BCRC 21397 / CBS 2163 / NBRC 10782 / NRRL Y-8283 / UCD 57-17) TaxID=436907 RepID=A7TFY1_VANPO|nr:uncharacterized protein Kpol_1028p10 [Vanderwaltozyma polyspora DSM 70294]EDO18738.1 hypothetical protein Kpol_1028p10 [Vanderwaltozyma polyspora DSM 70294]
MLVPPANFGIAEEGVYRCSKVDTLNLSFLETLNLKTVIFIGGQDPSKFFKEFFKSSNIKWHIIRNSDFSGNVETITPKSKSSSSNNASGRTDLEGKKDSVETSRKRETYYLKDSDELMLVKSNCLKKAFNMILNTNNYNVLLVDRTAIVVGILRKLQKWNIASVINEYRLFAGKNVNYFAETFLELIELSIEQEIDDDMITQRIRELQLAKNPSILPEALVRCKSESMEMVNEDDLLEAPKVPERILKLIGEAEAQNNTIISQDEIDTKNQDRNHGIFGNQYRLVFNKKERGEYEFYENIKPNIHKDSLVVIKIPIEPKLPEWFKFQRDLWEEKNVKQDNIFYAEIYSANTCFDSYIQHFTLIIFHLK